MSDSTRMRQTFILERDCKCTDRVIAVHSFNIINEGGCNVINNIPDKSEVLYMNVRYVLSIIVILGSQ